WNIDPAGHEYAVKDNEMVEVSPPGQGGELYSDEHARAAAPPGRDPGGIIALEYERRERPYLAETNWFFQDDVPRENQSFTLVMPPGFHYTTTWSHHAKIEPTELPNSALRWQVDHQKAIDLSEVPLSPNEEALSARMTVHYSGPGLAAPQEGTWKGIGLWYDGLSHDRIVATPEIAAKAAELTAGKTDFYDKAEAIGEFVQQKTRYFVVEMGIGGYQPHYAQDIFRGRYGDCKDKATLLAAMLSSVGIHSDLMMVDTHRGVVDPDAPSIVGNHMIGAIEIPAGYSSPKLHSVVTAATGKRYLIFDPTWDLTPFGQLEGNLQGSYGVLVEGPNSQVIQLPVLDPSLNRVERAGTFHLATDGTLKGEVTEKRFGDLAEQRRYEFTRDAKAQQDFLDRSISRDFMAVSLSDVKIENVQALNKDLTLKYNLEANHFASATGPLLMVRPRVVGSEAMPIDRKSRRVGIDLGETMQATDTFDIELPEGYSVDELPEPIKMDFDFASYESSTELRGHTLHYTRTYRVKEITLPADRYPDLQKLAGIIAADEGNRAVLKRAN
ncbi:MAG TPA: DUF3857 domain-containing protein, partial [Acidobacteriaceae bacterium]|nr:DUF3857 domain-containing protein [Acidobacteriaceae bacterium]